MLLIATLWLTVAAVPAAETKPTVAIVGASYAAGWCDLRIPGHHVRNLGVGGSNTTQMLESLRTLESSGERPAAVILWGFINEFSQSGMQKLPEVHERVKRNWLEMIAIAERMGAKVILATELTIRHPEGLGNAAMNALGGLLGKTSYQKAINIEVLRANVWVRDLARERGFAALDLQPALSDEDGYRIKKYAQPDGGHVTEAGYRVLTAQMTPLVQHALR